MGYTCPVCKTNYENSQDCGACGFPAPPRLFLSESHAKNWFNAEVLPSRAKWETKFRLSKLEELVKSLEDENQKLWAEIENLKQRLDKATILPEKDTSAKVAAVVPRAGTSTAKVGDIIQFGPYS